LKQIWSIVKFAPSFVGVAQTADHCCAMTGVGKMLQIAMNWLAEMDIKRITIVIYLL